MLGENLDDYGPAIPDGAMSYDTAQHFVHVFSPEQEARQLALRERHRLLLEQRELARALQREQHPPLTLEGLRRRLGELSPAELALPVIVEHEWGETGELSGLSVGEGLAVLTLYDPGNT